MYQTFLIGNAHLDPVWLWQWYEGYAEVKATFRSALDRMKEFPEYKFTSACAAYYEWIKESDPEMFDEIRARVAEGRWGIAGGWYIQPDCNIPSGESFARQALISQRFFQKEFGKTAKTGYNVDSFGHNGSIPMLLRQSGMDAYVFMRPEPHEKPEIPDWLFRWESPDGSQVKAYRIPRQYNYQKIEGIESVAAEATEHPMMAFFGVGNHGGGPTIKLLTEMEKRLGAGYVYATPDEFFEATGEDLPVVRDDLQFHAKGCYSVCSMIKVNNRKSENMLYAAEAFSTLSGCLAETAYPTEELTRAWKNTLFNQFHDVLGGCSIKSAYVNAAMTHGETQAIADRTINFACQQISWNINTIGNVLLRPDKPGWGAGWTNEGVGTPVVVFNALPWDVTAFVTIHDLPKRMTDVDGTPLPSQAVRAERTNFSEDKWEIGFLVTLPALGYKTLRAFYQEEEDAQEEGATKKEANVAQEENVLQEAGGAAKEASPADAIENDRLRLKFDPENGELVSIIEKASGRELLAGPTRTVLVDETDSDTWAHNIREFKKETDVFSEGGIKVIENGPVRWVMRTFTRGAHTEVRRDYTLVQGSDEITVRTKIDFREQHRMLKFRVPVALNGAAGGAGAAEAAEASAAEALCEIPFGTIARPTDGTEQVCQRWAALKDASGAGLAILNDSKYSFDADGNVLSLTVLRGAIYADHYGARDEFCEYMDQGIHEFTYAILPFSSITETTRRAAELNVPPFAVLETFHEGKNLPTSQSGIRVEPENILVTAVKKHEDSGRIVVRAYECEDRDTEAAFNVFGTCFKVDFGHRQVKTFVIDTKDGSVLETNFLEE